MAAQCPAVGRMGTVHTGPSNRSRSRVLQECWVRGWPEGLPAHSPGGPAGEPVSPPSCFSGWQLGRACWGRWGHPWGMAASSPCFLSTSSRTARPRPGLDPFPGLR